MGATLTMDKAVNPQIIDKTTNNTREKTMTCTLLIAGGVGARMGQDIPKQFLHINDKPVLVYTMERFQNNPQIDGIVIVTLPSWIAFVEAYAKQFGITKLKSVVAGGETGHDSIHNGILEISKHYPLDTAVMIHDGIRPMVDNDIISDNLSVYREKGNATVVIPCAEVIFQSEVPTESNKVLDRSKVWRTQTPQTFRLDKLLWAHEEVVKRGLSSPVATCHLFEMLGETVYFSKGSEKNIKLTTMDDIDIFKALLNTEKSSWVR